jgi:uncharacterized protein
MLITKRRGTFLASTRARRAAAVAAAWLLMHGHAASSPLADPLKKTAAPQTAAVAPVQRAACPLQPATAVAGKKDGQFVLQSDLSAMKASHVASFIVLGKEAAAAGRPRDAEVAFLMSCRVADKLKGMDATESADAKYQLGWLYARLVLEGGSAGASRAELRGRAERLYADSLRTYQARHGPAHEKTRFAAEGLAALGQAPGPAPQGASRPGLQASMPPQPRQAAPALPPPREPEAAASPGPSFDCARARSVPEKLICADAELARLDRELGRLYARAKDAAADGAAFGRQNSQEWRRREATCRDRECLLRWYADRHGQLTSVLQGQGR